jgi:hypothetical protein
MSKVRSNGEPVERMAELYYFMAKEMVERMGPELGKDSIRAAIHKFGEARLASMKEEARENSLMIHRNKGSAETNVLVLPFLDKL